ncbi:hypothetical protein CA13_36520 [Planctomycetes bacterium CA13]|uniref:Uncharacterized protein n=2 Tax=Novipirellula herctigrandis TaxID=2527986 RepID=A0A5C5Z5U0_9BACT|nr:hypothetical protein CA13_36520 [Planctomycetes bacterium CA13]
MKSEENVVERLKRRSAEAKKLGFHLRTELLDGEQATWCMIGMKKTIFIDLSQTAAEQLRTLDEILADFRNEAKKSQPARQKSPSQAA